MDGVMIGVVKCVCASLGLMLIAGLIGYGIHGDAYLGMLMAGFNR